MEESQTICKICHLDQSEKPEKLCNPCKCAGTMKFVHETCLFMYVKNSGKKNCTICKYEYKFKEIYKEATPDILPFSLIVKEMYDLCKLRFWSILKFLMTGVRFSFSFTSNAVILAYTHWFFRSNMFILFVSSLLMFGLSYLIFTLYASLYEYTADRESRRNVRIEMRRAIRDVSSDVILQGQVDNYRLLMTENLRRDLLTLRDNVVLHNTTQEIEESSIRNTRVIPTYRFRYSPLSSIVLYLVLFVNQNISFNLQKLYFYDFIKINKLDLFVNCILILMIINSYIWMYKRKSTVFYRFMMFIFFALFRILQLVLIDSALIVFLCTKLMKNEYSINISRYNNFYGTIIYLIIGIYFSAFCRSFRYLCIEHVRKGLLWYHEQYRNSDLQEIYSVTKCPLSFVFFNVFVVCFVKFCSIFIFLFTIRNEIVGCFHIHSFSKLIFIMKLILTFSDSLQNILKFLIALNFKIIRFLSRCLQMNNFLFGEKIPIEKCKHGSFKWSPCKQKCYDIHLIRKKLLQKVSERDVKHYYCKEKGSYTICFLPKFYRFYNLLLFLISIFNIAFGSKCLLSIVKFIFTNLKLRVGWYNEIDACIYIGILGLLSFCLTKSVYIFSIFRYKNKILYTVWVYLISPVWYTFVFIFCHGSINLKIMPSYVFAFFFASASFWNALLLHVLFPSVLQSYSVRRIFTRLLFITAHFTFLLCTYKYIGSILIDNFYLIFTVIFASLIVSRLKFVYSIFNQFYENIKKKHFLLSLEAVNYD